MPEKRDISGVPGESISASKEPPPSYAQTQQPLRDDGLNTTDDLSVLVLDDTKVYSLFAPTRTLYEWSNSPYEAKSKVYGIEKIRYRVTDTGAGSTLTHGVDHIYDMNHDFLSLGNDITLTGKTSQKRTYKNATVSRGIGGGIRVDGLLKAETPLKDRLNQGRNNNVVWKDHLGHIIAVETRLQRDKDNKVVELPRLTIKAIIEEKLYDLLVTCWCASRWKEAEKDLKEPMNWEKFKRISSTATSKAPGIWG
ncbi:hypothetical protein FHETE_2003 [Fusarium heterosporum]|uniref:Uncharacterized protein n=1 Tax=Fusarium heterosporum TaxID=42747 RepID=A0A8H5TR16_FUSHE|nr:hypothetical protein FHETE_2003 [Fusarium heterosporum]